MDLPLQPEPLSLDRSPVRDVAASVSPDTEGRARAQNAVSAGFASVYGPDAPAAARAFAEAARIDAGAAVDRLARQPAAFGALVPGDDLADRTARLANALPAALAIEAVPRGDGASGAVDVRTREPEREPDSALRKALDFLYDLAESPGGSIAMAVGSVVPGLDQALDVIDVGLNLDRVAQPEHRGDVGAWTNLGVTVIGAAIPLGGDAVEAALKSVLTGGRRAAASAMETLAPALRRVGLDPADYLDDLARRVPELFSEGLDVAADRLGGVLDGLAQPRRFVPDRIERAAASAADDIRSLAASAREPLGQVADEISGALQDLADAARRGTGETADVAADARRAAPPPPDRPPDRPDGRPGPEVVALRRETAAGFYREQGMDAARIDGHLQGIDFDHPVEVVTVPRGTVVEQYNVPGTQGNYYVLPGTSPETVGISLDVLDRRTGAVVRRERSSYVLTEDVSMLQSTARAIDDTWSVPGRSVPTHGGGLQLFTTSKDAVRRADR